MDIERQKIVNIIYKVIDQINMERDEEDKIAKSEDAILLGPEGMLDSFGLMSLIMDTEQLLKLELGIVITITDEKMMCQSGYSPFENVKTFTDYLMAIIGRQR